jgi:unsaturated chondroitin disaccharide hydrolase
MPISYGSFRQRSGNGSDHKPNRIGIDECCIWGDYFYLEALLRLTRSWNSYW